MVIVVKSSISIDELLKNLTISVLFYLQKFSQIYSYFEQISVYIEINYVAFLI